MDTKIRVEIASPPDRNKLVANLIVGNEQLAEINQEGSELQLELYPRRDGGAWLIGFDEMVVALQAARRSLVAE
jgi:hypothetical protein